MSRNPLAIFALPLLLSACASAGGPRQLPLPTTSTKPPEPAATVISTLALATQTNNPPTPLPGPSLATLSPEGPWLVLQTEDQGLLVADFDGPGLQLIPAPSDQDHPCEEVSAVAASPRGGLLSFKCLTSALDYELWVASLPSAEVVARLPLLGEEAIEADAAPHESAFPWAPPAQSAIWWSEPMWSPSGRYLAYSAAPSSSSTDVHIYDAETGETSRLTSGPNQTLILGWSPDSHWIVHASYFYGDIDKLFEALWAVSSDGLQLDKLYDINDWVLQEGIVGWASPNEVITERVNFEACNTHFRSTVVGESSRLLFPGGFYSASYDPVNGSALIAQSTTFFCSTDNPGLFALDIDTAEYRQLAHTGYWSVSWEPGLAAFLAIADSGSLDIIAAGGERLASIPGLSSADPSPDGNWLIGHSDTSVALLNAQGETVVQSLSEDWSYYPVWHPDSSHFAILRCSPCSPGPARLQVYSLGGDWRIASERQLPFSFSSREIILVAK